MRNACWMCRFRILTSFRHSGRKISRTFLIFVRTIEGFSIFVSHSFYSLHHVTNTASYIIVKIGSRTVNTKTIFTKVERRALGNNLEMIEIMTEVGSLTARVRVREKERRQVGHTRHIDRL